MCRCVGVCVYVCMCVIVHVCAHVGTSIVHVGVVDVVGWVLVLVL